MTEAISGVQPQDEVAASARAPQDEVAAATTEKADSGKRSAKARRAGQIIECGERKQMIRIFQGCDALGKRRYHNKLFHGTKTQAQKWLNDALVRLDKGEPIEASPITVDEYLDKWLAEAAKKRLRERTHQGYEDLMRRYVRPVLGKQRLADVTPLDLQGLYTKMSEAGLSARTVRYVHAVLSSAFKQAMKWEMLERDITRLVDLPKQQRQEMRALTPEEAGRFLTAVRGDRYAVLFNVALMSGMRPEEYLALQWKDVDWQRGAVTVQRALIWRDGGGWKYEEPTLDSASGFGDGRSEGASSRPA